MIRFLFILTFLAVPFVHAADTKPADGMWRTYDRKGNLDREENYRNKMLHGEIRAFYPSGALRSVTQYMDGKRQGDEKTYYEKGGLAMESNYANNDMDGLSRHYYDTGELEREAFYKNGGLHGETKVYYKSGALKQQLPYKNGVLDGTALTFDEGGQVTMEENYKTGNLVNRKDYGTDSAGLLKGTPPAAPAAPKLDSKSAAADKPIQPPK